MNGRRTRFRVWAPNRKAVELHLLYPEDRLIPMQGDDRGYYEVMVEGLGPGAKYLFRLDGKLERPDPASRFQPTGVHAPSEVPARQFPWTDSQWFGMPLKDFVIYELHVGTFTPEGTFDSAISQLDRLANLGITAIELLPVAQFPGGRNWGYDGVYLFAPQSTYGGPEGLKRLVDAAHARGIAVLLDVVYNHLGPEGNYLNDFGPYFTDRYRPPWGKALNFDGPHSDEVRQFFIENALCWVDDFHLDGLRLDAIYEIVDRSAIPFLNELAAAVRSLASAQNRRIHLIAETNQNDTRVITSHELGGTGLDAQWNDDFHHALHTVLSGELKGYYAGFGKVSQLAKALREGYVYAGQYSATHRRRHGSPSRAVPGDRFVVYSQNHDQVGNRMHGERRCHLLTLEECKLAAGVVLLSPYIPLLFMGEEYGETAPFQYFVSHGDMHLVDAVRSGRRREFHAFGWDGEPPDPQAEETFLRSKLNLDLRGTGHHAILEQFYRELIRMRREVPAFGSLRKDDVSVENHEGERVIAMVRTHRDEAALVVFNFSGRQRCTPLEVPEGNWVPVLDSSDPRWGGPGGLAPACFRSEGEAVVSTSPKTVLIYLRETSR